MRILTVLDGEPWGEAQIAGSLAQLGHDVHRFVYGRAVGEYYGRSRRNERNEKNAALLARARTLVKAGGLDLIFCYVYDDFLLPECARELAALGIPMVNYNVDMTTQWYRQIGIAKYFSYSLCAQRANIESLAAYGARTLYFPMAAHKPDFGTADCSSGATIAFVGSATQYRDYVLSALQECGLPLAVYGRNWNGGGVVAPEHSSQKTLSDTIRYALPRIRHEGVSSVRSAFESRLEARRSRRPGSRRLDPGCVRGPLAGDSLARVFHNSLINVGFTRMRGADFRRPGVNQVKLRDFEVPLAAGFYLVEEAPEHRELYEVGREIETWKTVEELIEKARYYLAHPQACQDIAAAGHRRALRDHTWERRFSSLFELLRLSGA